MTPDKFEENFIIHDHEADCMRRFTPGAVLRRAQQVSTDHCDTLGLTAQVYEQTHTAFLLAKLSVQWHRQLHTGDEVHAVTHPSAPQRATYYRLTEFYHARTGALALHDRYALGAGGYKHKAHPAQGAGCLAYPLHIAPPPRDEAGTSESGYCAGGAGDCRFFALRCQWAPEQHAICRYSVRLCAGRADEKKRYTPSGACIP